MGCSSSESMNHGKMPSMRPKGIPVAVFPADLSPKECMDHLTNPNNWMNKYIPGWNQDGKATVVEWDQGKDQGKYTFKNG